MTDIEWTHVPGYKGETWNPVRGAETFAERWRGIPGHPYEQGFDLRLVPSKLDQPVRWTKPRSFFVNSMSDLLHQGVPFFFKQTGPRPLVQHPMEPGALLPVQMLARKGNNPAEWPEDLCVREWPKTEAA